MRQSLRLDFSVIENFESMQTINNKRKYKIQQLFKMLYFSVNASYLCTAIVLSTDTTHYSML